MTSHYRWQLNWQPLPSGALQHVPTGLVATSRGIEGDTRALAVKHGPHNTPAILGRLEREAQALRECAAAGQPVAAARIPKKSARS